MSPSAKGARESELIDQIRSLVASELERYANQTELRVDGWSLVIGRGAAGPRADIQGTVEQWDSLPNDLRERRIVQIAGLLAPARTSGRGRARPTPGSRRLRWLSRLWAASIILMTGGALVLAYRYFTPQGSALRIPQGPPRASPLLSDPERKRSALARTACQLSRARVARGANVGASDVEGWIVELVLLRRTGDDLVASPALAGFLAKKPGSNAFSVNWPGARSLTDVKRFDAEVDLVALPAAGDNRLNGAKLAFSGPYVAPYFNEAQRAEYLMLADALAEASGATDGALYARCVGAENHDIGSWFLGATPGAAVSSLVYYMAGFSDPPPLRPSVRGSKNDPLASGHTIDVINDAAAGMDRSAVATLVGRERGMISGRPNQPVRLTFPFRDGNRAARASIAIARALKLADPG